MKPNIERGMKMKSAILKETKPSKGYSVNDMRLKKYLELKEAEKEIKKELEQLKVEIEHSGSHTTKHFVVTVTPQTRTYAPGLEKLRQLYPDIDKHTNEVTFNKISISKKGGE